MITAMIRAGQCFAPALVAVLTTLASLAAEIPSGTPLQIRLTTELSSAKAQPGQSFSAVLIAPVVVNGAVVMNAGAVVTGDIQSVTAAVKPDGRALIAPRFLEIRGGDAKAKLAARLTDVDNARETVNDQGQIVGIEASQTLSTRLDQGIGKLTDRYAQFGGLLGAVKGKMLNETDPDIDYPPGVEMTITLTRPLLWTAPVTPSPLAAIAPADALVDLANSEPFRTYTQGSNRPSDITNIMLLGSEDQIEAAFQAAGWTAAGALNEESKYETFRAMAEQRGYSEAPMSVLLLGGRPPDLTYQKVNNTFSARHHIRLFRRPETFDGKPVWVCSSTHDTGIDFSEQNRTFIHKIDSDIDHERAKVVSDLVFSGYVKAIALVDRDAVPTTAVNGTGDAIKTDGRMAALEF